MGGSGKCRTTHVKLIVEPMPMYKSGAPTIVVIGSVAAAFAVIPHVERAGGGGGDE